MRFGVTKVNKVLAAHGLILARLLLFVPNKAYKGHEKSLPGFVGTVMLIN